MFIKDQKIEDVIEIVKTDKNAINNLSYEQLVKLLEYLEDYKQFLLKKNGGVD